MKIVVDGFGGDNAPLEILKGCQMAVEEFPEIEIIITGDERLLGATALENGINMNRIAVSQADSIITMEDEPTAIMGAKKDSSMAKAFQILANDEADACVTAGNTGAAVVGGSTIIKRLKGVRRPALTTFIPGVEKDFLLLDIGANVEVRPEMLVQFAIMGSAYMESVLGRENPTVGLLNNGAEEHKGTEMHKEAYKLLSAAPVNFIGNVEGSDINKNKADIVVADGFSGNIVLKVTEGLAGALMKIIKHELTNSGMMVKIGAGLAKPAFKKLAVRLDPNERGGAPLLGTRKPLIKAHGSSNAFAFKNAIKQAISFHENDVTGKMQEGLAKINSTEN